MLNLLIKLLGGYTKKEYIELSKVAEADFASLTFYRGYVAQVNKRIGRLIDILGGDK